MHLSSGFKDHLRTYVSITHIIAYNIELNMLHGESIVKQRKTVFESSPIHKTVLSEMQRLVRPQTMVNVLRK